MENLLQGIVHPVNFVQQFMSESVIALTKILVQLNMMINVAPLRKGNVPNIMKPSVTTIVLAMMIKIHVIKVKYVKQSIKKNVKL